MPDVELVSVSYRNRTFPEHRHEEFVIGAVMAGSETLTVGGATHVASAGSVLRLRPGEAHANATVGRATLRYRVLYVPSDVLAQYGGVPAEGGSAFAYPVMRDPRVHRTVADAHAILSSPTSSRFEQESALCALTQAMDIGTGIVEKSINPRPEVVEQARIYIDMNASLNFGLCDLAELTGVSPFHLVHVFKKAIGISPLAYRNQRRLVEARRLLIAGKATSQIALDLGYADQSHFTRHFQRIVGVSPQRYAKGAGPIIQGG